MPFVPATNIVEVFMEHQYHGVQGKGYVLHYDNSLGPWTLPLMAELATELIDWWTVQMRPLVNNQTVLERIRMRDITQAEGLVYDTSTGLPLAGSRAGTPVQSQVVISVKKATGLAGKSQRGRVYHFGFNQGDFTGTNTLSTAYTALVETAWNAALGLVGATANYDMQLVSKFTGGQPRTIAEVRPITAMSLVDRRVDTNRLKLPKGGA